MLNFIQKAALFLAVPLALVAWRYGQQWLRDTEQGLTRTVRSTFVEAAIDSCTTTATNEQANNGLSPSLISQYCNCHANGMADILSISEVKAMEKTGALSADAEEKSMAVAERCIDAIAKQ